MYTMLKRGVSLAAVTALFLTMTFTVSIDTTYAAAAPKALTLKTQGNLKTVDVGASLRVSVAKTKPAKAENSVSWKLTEGTKSAKLAKKSTSSVLVKGSKTGTVKVTAVSKAKKSVKKMVTIQVKNLKAKKVTLSKSTLKLAPGKTSKLKASVTAPQKYGYKKQKTKWTTSNPKVAAVSADGTVTAKTEGTAVIKAANDGKSAACKVTVASGAPAVESKMSMTDDVKKMIDNIDLDYAEKVMDTLAYDKNYFDDVTGFRTAGSDAEHKASQYLASKWQEIGLSDVERVPVAVDKWQFNKAALSIQNEAAGVDVSVKTIVSYASNGTVQKAKAGDSVYQAGSEGVKDGELIYMNHGYQSDYEAYYDEQGLTKEKMQKAASAGTMITDQDVEKARKAHMKNKIVLADINQDMDFWITPHYTEAYEQGAAAIATYSSQYIDTEENDWEEKWETAIQIQDLCAADYIPCVSINRQDGLKLKEGYETIQKAVADKKLTAEQVKGSGKLMVDNEIVKDGGTAYNVVGTIKGSGNTGQRIMLAGHYDKYFYGLNDDCAAIGLVAGVAKAMKDSGYQPYYDIVFVAHAAEEWGKIGVEADWGQGSWEMITEAKPEWQNSTIALLNYELPAKQTTDNKLNAMISGGRESDTIIKGFLNKSGLQALFPQKEGTLSDRYYDTQPMSDAICYQYAGGVPCYEVQATAGKKVPSPSTYHTPYDDYDDYSSAAMQYAITTSTALAAYIDGTPAMELDYNARCDALENSVKGNDALYKEAGVNAAAFRAAISDLRAANKAYLEKAQAINAEYENAYMKKADEDTLKAIRTKGDAQNAITLKAYKELNDSFLAMKGGSAACMFNEIPQENIALLDEMIAALKTEPYDQGRFMNHAWQLNTGVEYMCYEFSREVCLAGIPTGFPGYTDLLDKQHKEKFNWAVTDNRMYTKSFAPTNTFGLTYDWIHGAISQAEAAAQYTKARTSQLGYLKESMDKELKGMETIEDLLRTGN